MFCIETNQTNVNTSTESSCDALYIKPKRTIKCIYTTCSPSEHFLIMAANAC